MSTNPNDLTDENCASLMTALDDMDHDVRDRDAGFIESNLGRVGRYSGAQKKWCANLVDRYADYLAPDWREYYKPGPPKPEVPKPTVEDDALGAALS